MQSEITLSEAEFTKTTGGITITVRPSFLEDQSSPEENQYLWAYHVRIENSGDSSVQLLNRLWQITDGLGQQQEVRGPGVVGEQPVIEPGDAFEYTSGCPLTTPTGFMVGEYGMTTLDGQVFDVGIPLFSLDSPHDGSQIH